MLELKAPRRCLTVKNWHARQASLRAPLPHNYVLRARQQRSGCGGTFSGVPEFRTLKRRKSGKPALR
jgi:hypothetical protein